MKFTDLTSEQRSMLTMLCTGQVFNTSELGRGCNPRADGPKAAHLLMDLREKGIVFSSQKRPGVPYAQWRASEYGREVFAGRPGTWVVYESSGGSAAVYTATYHSEADAIAYASRQVDKLGRVFHVAKLIARVKPVQQPTFEIERV